MDLESFYQNEKMIRVCPVCKEEREFIGIVEVHTETTPLPWNAPIGPASRGMSRTYLQETKLPLAYCSECKVVIFVGPTPEEKKEEFERRKSKTPKSSIPFCHGEHRPDDHPFTQYLFLKR